MAATRTPGITLTTNGHRLIDKRYRGVRIGVRLGAVSQESAERRLRKETEQIDLKCARHSHTRPLFRDCAARYLAQSGSAGRSSLEAIHIRVRLVLPHVGHLEQCRLRAAGVSAEDRSTLLGHAQHSMAGHYSIADVGRLMKIANLVLKREETCTVLRVANGWPVQRPLWTSGPQRSHAYMKDLVRMA